jgi:hypothetical protein
METAGSFEAYEDAWSGFLEATYRITNRIKNACGKENDRTFKSWFGRFEARRSKDPFLRYAKHARNAETHTVQISTTREPGTMKIEPRDRGGHIRTLKLFQDGVLEITGDGVAPSITFTPGRVKMVPAVDRGLTFDPPDEQPPHIYARAALSFFTEWVEVAESKYDQ